MPTDKTNHFSGLIHSNFIRLKTWTGNHSSLLAGKISDSELYRKNIKPLVDEISKISKSGLTSVNVNNESNGIESLAAESQNNQVTLPSVEDLIAEVRRIAYRKSNNYQLVPGTKQQRSPALYMELTIVISGILVSRIKRGDLTTIQELENEFNKEELKLLQSGVRV